MGDIYFVDDSEYKNPETLALHGGNYRFDPVTSAVTVPIYRSTSFQFRDTENAANLFALQEFGNIYSRMMNPTNDALEQRLAALEGGRAALSVSSGQAATTFCILNVAQAGDNIVSSIIPFPSRVSRFDMQIPWTLQNLKSRSMTKPGLFTPRLYQIPTFGCSPSRRFQTLAENTTFLLSSTTLRPRSSVTRLSTELRS